MRIILDWWHATESRGQYHTWLPFLPRLLKEPSNHLHSWETEEPSNLSLFTTGQCAKHFFTLTPNLYNTGFTNDLPGKGSKPDTAWTPTLMAHPVRPTAVFIGFSHCGGKAIASVLASHPDIIVNKKEEKYFTGKLLRSDWKEWKIEDEYVV